MHNRLDELLRVGIQDADSKQRNDVMDVAKTLLENPLTLNEEAAIVAKLRRFKQLGEPFWLNYMSKLENRIKLTHKIVPQHHSRDVAGAERDGRPDTNIRGLLELAQSLLDENVSSKNVATLFVRWVKNHIYDLVPGQLDLFNGIVEYIFRTGQQRQLSAADFDPIAECAWEFESHLLVDTLYLLGKLGIKNETVLTTVGRVIHNDIALGKLSPYHKTKLARAYALLKHNHITFYSHIAEELRIIFQGKDIGKYSSETVTRKSDYVEGIVSATLAHPSGVICEILPRINTDGDVDEQRSSVESIAFTGLKEQLYSDGQIIYILDSMLYLNLHHLERYFVRLLSSAIKHCYTTQSLAQFDVEQLRSAITLLAQCGKTVDDTVVEFISRRFIQSYVDGQATNAQLTLFLKDLVKYTRQVTKKVNRRGRICFKAAFPAPTWLRKPLSEMEDAPGGNAAPSMLESCCAAICQNVHSFEIVDLTSCIRSVAYLGLRNENFFKAFIPFFKDKIASVSHLGITNLTQALIKANVRDDHLFYLMGQQHQLSLLADDKAHKLYVKRIG
ncbi:ATP-dependent Clp protease proteolytic subunit, putative [Babesia ovata]|uniref:ATP-dependent Clp protease proteolytic subunit, putative n=1 Tax=Babesia ovata TaxID=189622 RepID=A0A2H6KHF6_9APIC|nr:ATP-dependent Clp protease proteolytic subunit, putative [Babesia ovata]GBE62425.1 ATP-dependent Clp protease proteolytic subunit, putative [Babesia ovata]